MVRGLGHVTYISILGFLNISGISKVTNSPKVINGDDGNLRAELPSWSRAELIVGGGWGRGVPGLCLETTHLHTCQSIFNFACNLVHKRFEDAKNQSACYIFPSSFPLPARGQLQKSGIELAVIVLCHCGWAVIYDEHLYFLFYVIFYAMYMLPNGGLCDVLSYCTQRDMTKHSRHVPVIVFILYLHMFK